MGGCGGVMLEGDEWRKVFAAPLGVLFWGVVLSYLRSRRKEPTYSDASDIQKPRYLGYLLGRKVRRFWDRVASRY